MIKFKGFAISLVLITLFILVAETYAQQAGYFALDRARGAAGVPAPNAASSRMGGIDGPIGPAAMGPAGMMGQNGMGMGMGFGMQNGYSNTPLIPEEKTIRVMEGEIVKSAKSGEILWRPEIKEVPESMKNQYYDDGSHGDELAGDAIYSNLTVRMDVISKEEYAQRLKLENLIALMASDNPVEFYRIYIASDTRNPYFKSIGDLRSQKEAYIEDYKERVLKAYKNEKGEFYPVFEPPKPKIKPLMNMAGLNQNGRFGMGMQNVGLAAGTQGRVNQAMGQGDFGDVGATRSSYFGERNAVK